MSSATPTQHSPTGQVDRFDVWLVNLDPTMGSEIQYVPGSGHFAGPDEPPDQTAYTLAPMTTAESLPDARARVRFGGKEGKIVLYDIDYGGQGAAGEEAADWGMPRCRGRCCGCWGRCSRLSGCSNATN